MKLKVLILLLFIVMVICSPINITIGSEASPILLSLNVCSYAFVSLSSNYDNPIVFNNPIHYLPNKFAGYVDDSNSTFYKLTLASTLERPPKV